VLRVVAVEVVRGFVLDLADVAAEDRLARQRRADLAMLLDRVAIAELLATLRARPNALVL
jgi:hypothetical protein